MASKRVRLYFCDVIHEEVRIYLRDKRRLVTQNQPAFFVQCNQEDCQYVDENKLPCPLNIAMFADEMKAKEEERKKRKENV